jgi:hypothetical protein
MNPKPRLRPSRWLRTIFASKTSPHLENKAWFATSFHHSVGFALKVSTPQTRHNALTYVELGFCERGRQVIHDNRGQTFCGYKQQEMAVGNQQTESGQANTPCSRLRARISSPCINDSCKKPSCGPSGLRDAPETSPELRLPSTPCNPPAIGRPYPRGPSISGTKLRETKSKATGNCRVRAVDVTGTRRKIDWLPGSHANWGC